MGLFIDRVRFEEESPSDEITTMLEPLTHPYLLELLLERGGVPLDFSSRSPRAVEFPPYVERAWKEHSWWTRTKIHVAFNFGLLGTALATAREAPTSIASPMPAPVSA